MSYVSGFAVVYIEVLWVDVRFFKLCSFGFDFVYFTWLAQLGLFLYFYWWLMMMMMMMNRNVDENEEEKEEEERIRTLCRDK